jgi:PncC family amidohydrolase
MDPILSELSTKINERIIPKKLTIATAESCTGGLIAHVLTLIPGASNYFIGGVIAYSNQVKQDILGVQASTLAQFGAVSEQTAIEMAAGVRERFNTDIGMSTTGIAGPSGGTPSKPVGLVWIGFSTPEKTWAVESHFSDDRHQINKKSARKALQLLLDYLEDGITRFE